MHYVGPRCAAGRRNGSQNGRLVRPMIWDGLGRRLTEPENPPPPPDGLGGDLGRRKKGTLRRMTDTDLAQGSGRDGIRPRVYGIWRHQPDQDDEVRGEMPEHLQRVDRRFCNTIPIVAGARLHSEPMTSSSGGRDRARRACAGGVRAIGKSRAGANGRQLGTRVESMWDAFAAAGYGACHTIAAGCGAILLSSGPSGAADGRAAGITAQMYRSEVAVVGDFSQACSRITHASSFVLGEAAPEWIPTSSEMGRRVGDS